MRIQIGAAQFGNSYGITNQRKVLTLRESWDILDLSLSYGITEVDTAPSYGDSFSTIAKYSGGVLNVTSKIMIKGLRASEINNLINSQIEQIGNLHSLKTILIHDFAELHESDLEVLAEVAQQTKTVKIGVSIYEPWELGLAKTYLGSSGTIQFPANILNQGCLEAIGSPELATYQLVARSLMLQGALDWEFEGNPFRRHSSITKIRDFSVSQGLRPIEIVIAFAKQLSADYILFGFNSKHQLKEFLNIWNANLNVNIDFKEYRSTDAKLIDPRKW